jgi:cell division protein FtsB
MEWIAFAASAVTALLSFLGVYMANRKQTVLMDYRLQQLEKKVGQHNNLEGRVITLETRMNDLHPNAS